MDCGKLYDKATAKGLRCPACQKTTNRKRDQQRGTPAQRGYDSQHAKRAKAVVDHAIANNIGCYYCGGPPTPSDPFVGCHLQPQSRGGPADGPLAAGHRSCNNAAAGKLNRGKRR
jgi:hypothetical protein